ncbi:AraC-like DNA-binding protein [Streptomyces sp. V1I6]|nr:AraC-like DNA-binding protein [Streptomyces sp. V1I6]
MWSTSPGGSCGRRICASSPRGRCTTGRARRGWRGPSCCSPRTSSWTIPATGSCRRLAERPWRDLDEQTHERTAHLIADLDDEYRRGAAGFATVLRALLHILVVRTARLPEPAPPPPLTRPGAVAEEFLRLVARNEPALWSAAACADRIGVSGGYLAEAVKAATGRTPGRLIREARTHEAKRLLARTDLTVRQVADRVGFTDPAYFCRFFRRETGVSPGAFRRGGDVHGDIHHDHRLRSIVRPEPSA